AVQSSPDSSLHPPQWVWLVVALTSHPLLNEPSQSKRLLAQSPTTHVPELQLTAVTSSSPTLSVQSLPQLPQYSLVVVRSLSQPFEKIPSQSPNPARQPTTVQLPAMHAVAVTSSEPSLRLQSSPLPPS